MKRRKASQRRKVTYGLLVLAVVMLLASAVGSTRAALTYYSENYTAEITVSQIGVSLLENGETGSSRDYNKNKWNETGNNGSASAVLLKNMLKKDEKLALNKKYDEKLSVKNSGTIDEYTRVRIYKYWVNPDGSKVTALSPDLIDLHLVNQENWVKNPKSTKECTELFYKGILKAGAQSKPFADTIRIDKKVASEVKTEKNGNVITTTYKYDGVQFKVDVEVDAVQTHNAQDAIRSAWGVDASALGIL